MSVKNVTITLKKKKAGDKTIEYDPDKPVFVEQDKDSIKWTCRHHFAIHLGNDGKTSPLPKGRYPGGKGAKVGDKVKKVLRKDEPRRTIKYYISVWDGTRIWTDDPTFIIEA